ncbi:MAG: hypothetical protein H7255_20270 [Ramlibacter sp.]|nr:hypothetical protein [Ramlibacter sp.]
MSCRALGCGIDDAVLYGVRTALEAEGATGLVAAFVEGPRNQPIRDFLVRTGFQEGAAGVFEHNQLTDLQLPEHVRLHALDSFGRRM